MLPIQHAEISRVITPFITWMAANNIWLASLEMRQWWWLSQEIKMKYEGEEEDAEVQTAGFYKSHPLDIYENFSFRPKPWILKLWHLSARRARSISPSLPNEKQAWNPWGLLLIWYAGRHILTKHDICCEQCGHHLISPHNIILEEVSYQSSLPQPPISSGKNSPILSDAVGWLA